jgi:hypothetical protein
MNKYTLGVIKLNSCLLDVLTTHIFIHSHNGDYLLLIYTQ